MFVPTKDWIDAIRFFRDFMGIVFDKRNYGTFNAAGVAAINDREING